MSAGQFGCGGLWAICARDCEGDRCHSSGQRGKRCKGGIPPEEVSASCPGTGPSYNENIPHPAPEQVCVTSKKFPSLAPEQVRLVQAFQRPRITVSLLIDNPFPPPVPFYVDKFNSTSQLLSSIVVRHMPLIIFFQRCSRLAVWLKEGRNNNNIRYQPLKLRGWGCHGGADNRESSHCNSL